MDQMGQDNTDGIEMGHQKSADTVNGLENGKTNHSFSSEWLSKTRINAKILYLYNIDLIQFLWNSPSVMNKCKNVPDAIYKWRSK